MKDTLVLQFSVVVGVVTWGIPFINDLFSLVLASEIAWMRNSEYDCCDAF